MQNKSKGWTHHLCPLFSRYPQTKPRAFHFHLESMEMLSVFVFAAKRRVKGAATLTSFALRRK